MSKISHILLMTSYQDGSGYQENILSKKHVQLGYDVTLISVAKEGQLPDSYINTDGVKVEILRSRSHWIRFIPYIRGLIPHSKGFRKKLDEVSPDILFVHGLAFPEVSDIVKYKRKNPNVRIYADNHQDYYNSPINSFRLKINTFTYLKYYAQSLANVCDHIWGVSPWRIDYCIKVFNLNPDKIGLLVMGGDEDYINWGARLDIRKRIREKCAIPEKAFLLVTGGRIDKAKNIHLLEEMVCKSTNGIYCLVFGTYNEEAKILSSNFTSERIKHVGWVNSNDVYNYFLAADLAVFPGTHSVLWEQACASGIPAIFKDWNGGFNHVDVGGNCILLKDPNVENLKETIQKIINNRQVYKGMLKVAQTDARKTFSYIQIAKHAILIE